MIKRPMLFIIRLTFFDMEMVMIFMYRKGATKWVTLALELSVLLMNFHKAWIMDLKNLLNISEVLKTSKY
jgi:hypothetical protein